MSTRRTPLPPNRSGAGSKRARWWGGFVVDGNPPKRRLVFRWKRIFGVLAALAFVGYLGCATLLWGYYRFHRKIAAVQWIDIAIFPRFDRVQAAIGARYFEDAEERWKKQDYVHAILTARASVYKAPKNLEARLFLAQCWLLAGRQEECLRTLSDGLAVHGGDARLQTAIVDACVAMGRFAELLAFLRVEFPAKGVDLLNNGDPKYRLMEARAVFEIEGAAAAEAIIRGYPDMAELPSSAPILAMVDFERGRGREAAERLRRAREKEPKNPSLHDAYIESLLRIDAKSDAKIAAVKFRNLYEDYLPAQLRYLETHGSRQGADRELWAQGCMQFLLRSRSNVQALHSLGVLAASQGWTDLNLLLYQIALQESHTSLPFAILYSASLVKAKDYSKADSIWSDLAVRNQAQLSTSAHISAMISLGSGRESEAYEAVARLRRETIKEPQRRRQVEQLFRMFGFPQLADALNAPDAPPKSS